MTKEKMTPEEAVETAMVEETTATTKKATKKATAKAAKAPEAEITTENAPEPEKVEETAPEKKRAKRPPYNGALEITSIPNFVDDGNDLVSAQMPGEIQRQEIKEVEELIKRKQVVFGKIYGVQTLKDGVVISLKYKNVRVIVPAEDFFAYSQMKDMEGNNKEEKMRRFRQKASHMLGGNVSFMMLAVDYDESGAPFVVASRRRAMDVAREKYFFGPNASVRLGTAAKASIISAGPRYVTVECLGVETVIGTGGLTAFDYVADPSKDDRFKVGTGLMVAVEELELDMEAREIKEIRFSHSLIERLDSNVPQVNEGMINGRYDATIVAVLPKHYVVIIKGEKIRGLVAIENLTGATKGETGDDIALLVTKISKEKNLVIGNAIKN